MARGVRIGSVVTFVRDLPASTAFYTDVLGLEVVDSSQTAALLASAGGVQLILRAMGHDAAHPLGSVGVQYVVWTAADPDDLDRCERALKARAAHRETRQSGKVTVVEGRDPDDILLIVVYPGPDEYPLHEIPVRIYGW
jgi:catechol 2,3-dioxygenase-like lactoylglutathione lyase family enzyme